MIKKVFRPYRLATNLDNQQANIQHYLGHRSIFAYFLFETYFIISGSNMRLQHLICPSHSFRFSTHLKFRVTGMCPVFFTLFSFIMSTKSGDVNNEGLIRLYCFVGAALRQYEQIGNGHSCRMLHEQVIFHMPPRFRIYHGNNTSLAQASEAGHMLCVQNSSNFQEFNYQ